MTYLAIICLVSLTLNVILLLENHQRGKYIETIYNDCLQLIRQNGIIHQAMTETLEILEETVEDPDIAAMDRLRKGLRYGEE